MSARLTRRAFASLALLPALRARAAPGAPDATAIRDAFVAFFPAYEMARLRWTAIEDTANPRRGRLNQFNHVRRLLDHTARNVTAPNNDTLYSSARVDLRHGPVVVETPAMPGRYHSLQVMNAHTDNLAILGRRDGGDGPLRVVIAGPAWAGPLPARTHAVMADTHDLWLLVRTLVDGPEDLAAVIALQDAMRISAPQPAGGALAQAIRPPKDPDAASFVEVVNEVLLRNPPQGAMAEAARLAAPLGLGGGRRWSDLAPDLREAWQAEWPRLPALLQDPALLRERSVGGWEYPPADLGRWGTNRRLRAAVALRGIAALDRAEALYLGATADADGNTLDGSRRWRVRVPPGGVPARAFWSLSMYQVEADGRSFFVDNPIGRYTIGNRTRGLKTNADGSLDLLLQADAPADAANWLPTPQGRFRLTLRAYLPEPALVAGSAPLPRIELQP